MNVIKLQEVKAHWDRKNVFHFSQSNQLVSPDMRQVTPIVLRQMNSLSTINGKALHLHFPKRMTFLELKDIPTRGFEIRVGKGLVSVYVFTPACADILRN